MTDDVLYDDPWTPPKRTLRQRARYNRIMLTHRIVRRWNLAFAPYRLHPDRLDGYDGEPPHYLRADLAKTAQDAIEYLLDEWGFVGNDHPDREHALEYMQPADEVGRVWMVERHTGELDEDGCWYDVVDWRPGAVEYWKWDEQ